MATSLISWEDRWFRKDARTRLYRPTFLTNQRATRADTPSTRNPELTDDDCVPLYIEIRAINEAL